MVTQAQLSASDDAGFTDVQEVQRLPGARELVGITISGRWELLRPLHDGPQESGGNFGVGYVARDRQDDIDRFVKVVDFRSRLTDLNQLTALLQHAQFEVAIHKACLRMSKVVRMAAHGQLVFRTPGGDEYNFLCLVLELGEGDIKSHVDFRPDRSPYWKLWVLREVALAVVQLDRANLAHNDIKPSNVIRFPSRGDSHSVKLGDVGRAVTKAGTGPFDGMPWAGDPRHKPIEVLYGWQEQEWQNRRTSADAYMLGNLACFLFVGVSLTERIVSSLPEQYRPGRFQGAYRDVLDLVRHAWAAVLTDQVMPALPAYVREELHLIIRWLTEPDPAVRGEPTARRGGTLGLDRIQSRLERIAQHCLVRERLMPKA